MDLWRRVISAVALLGCLLGPALTSDVRATGLGLATATLKFEPTSLDFGDVQVGSNGDVRPLKITNSGDAPLVLDYYGWAVTGQNAPGYILTVGNNCPFAFGREPQPLAPGASCTLILAYHPTGPGQFTAAEQITIRDSGTPQVVPLSANGVTPAGKPSLGQDTTGVGFGLRGVGKASPPRKATLTNYGDTPLTIGKIGISGRNMGDFSVASGCGTTIAPKASCAIDVIFTPGVPGAVPPGQGDFRDATLTIEDSAAGSPHRVVLFGEATAPEACFEATDICIDPRFFASWREHGALAINGYPISDICFEKLEDGKFYQVQYFERVRMEYHQEVNPPIVLLGQFGRALHPADPPVAALPGATFFAQTGHNVPPDFLTFWNANGGLAQFGLPLSEVFKEKLEDGRECEVQYFERARFERHPENPAPNTIQLGQFGRRILGGR